MDVDGGLTGVFGVIVAGKLIQTLFKQMSETEYVLDIGDAEAINHIVVFLTGTSPLPDGFGGCVFIRWQRMQTECNWHYLGSISNAKPSAIFRVAQLHKTEAAHGSVFTSLALPMGYNVAQIGISIEPLSMIADKVPAVGATPSHKISEIDFSEKMLKNFANYASSFVVSLPNPQNPYEKAEFVPASVLQRWFMSFSERLRINPHFWKSLE